MENSKNMLKRKLNMNLQRDICPVCGGQLVQIEIERDDESTYATATAKQKCKHCEGIIIQRRKWPKRKRLGR